MHFVFVFEEYFQYGFAVPMLGNRLERLLSAWDFNETILGLVHAKVNFVNQKMLF